jgi:hypothetical protein
LCPTDRYSRGDVRDERPDMSQDATIVSVASALRALMNTITVLPDTPLGRSEARFRQGNLPTCFRNVNQLLVYFPRRPFVFRF